MKKDIHVIFAILAAALYALNIPLSKLLLDDISPTMMAGLLYLGAGFGMAFIGIARKKTSRKIHPKFSREDLPYIIGMIILDILAPIFLMLGLMQTTAENASLLNNFEIVSTSLIAFFLFKEVISKRLWIGIILITISTIILSVNDFSAFNFSVGSIYVLIASILWGLENNCTRMLSSKDTLQIVVLKGLFSGSIALIIAFVLNDLSFDIYKIILTLLLGFVSYGLSIFFYVLAQRELGASKTSAFYAVAPFIGVILSFIVFQEIPRFTFFIALAIIIVGTYFASINIYKRDKTSSNSLQ